MKVALVHDWLTNMGGAEKLLEIFHRLFPDAPIYTLVYNQNKMPESFKTMDIRTSFLQKVPLARKKHQLFLQFMPLAFEQFDLSDYDLVLSSSTACAKGVITRASTCHICYCNTPMRYAWDFYHEYLQGKNFFVKAYIAWQLHKIRLWDRLSADRVDYFIANSKNVAHRIFKHYRRCSEVVYPPVDSAYYTPSSTQQGSYFLCAGRLVGYKRIDLAVSAFSKSSLPLWIAGEGPEYKKLKAMAGSNIKFLGRVDDASLRELYRGSRAFIFPGEEDYGITPLEVQACGKPVIAFGKGGSLETVIANKTGVFFPHQTVESLQSAVESFLDLEDSFHIQTIRNHAKTFSIQRFEDEIRSLVSRFYNEFKL